MPYAFLSVEQLVRDFLADIARLTQVETMR